MLISWNDFEKIEMHVGTILSASGFPKAKKPAYQLQIDFGPLGIRSSSAQITGQYSLEELPGKQVVAVLNFPPRQIADFSSECLVLGSYSSGGVVLLQPGKPVMNGDKVG
jgi:tRNA-binding protein